MEDADVTHLHPPFYENEKNPPTSGNITDYIVLFVDGISCGY